MNVNSVVKASNISGPSKDRKDITQERQHMYVKHVLKYSVMPGLLEIMKEFTLEKNPTNVGIWGTLDVEKKNLKQHMITHSGDGPCKCK